jgi:hypothetical protein
MQEQPQTIVYEKPLPEKSLVQLLCDYQNKKEHFFRVSQSYAPNPNDVKRALDLYMEASDKYNEAKFKSNTFKNRDFKFTEYTCGGCGR